MFKKVLIPFFIALIFMACCGLFIKLLGEKSSIIFAQRGKSEKEKENCIKLDFRFLEVSNAQYTSTSRQIEIFLDEKAFSEQNLKALFDYLSKEYPEPKRLTIGISTNWEQLPLPVDCSPGANGISDTSDQKPEMFDHYQARYYRDEKLEYFIYYPVLNTDKFKRVVLKGNR